MGETINGNVYEHNNYTWYGVGHISSNKYEVIMKKINDLEHTAQTLKQRLDQHNSQNSSKTFVENEQVFITGTFMSTSYAPNQFVFVAQAENVEKGILTDTWKTIVNEYPINKDLKDAL